MSYCGCWSSTTASRCGAICNYLDAEGYGPVDEAADGATAYALFGRTPYDVVITDWYMPHVSGLDLLRAIRSSARPFTPVLLLTGDISHEHEREGLAAGATGFVKKPLVALSLPHFLRQLA